MSAHTLKKQLLAAGMLVLSGGLGWAGGVPDYAPQHLSLDASVGQEVQAKAVEPVLDLTNFACPRPSSAEAGEGWQRLMQSWFDRIVRLAGAGLLRGVTEEDVLPTCVY